MDFAMSENQSVVSGLAHAIMRDAGTPSRLAEVEASSEVFDRGLWGSLAAAGLTALPLRSDVGGLEMGILEVMTALEVQGNYVPHVPLLAGSVAAATLQRFADPRLIASLLPELAAGRQLVVPAMEEIGRPLTGLPATSVVKHVDGYTLSGTKVGVDFAHVADYLLVTATHEEQPGLYLVDASASGLTSVAYRSTDRGIRATVTLNGAHARRVGGLIASRWLVGAATVAACALQLGVIDTALRMTAEYTSTRRQFGRALSEFQAVTMRAADGYVDVNALRDVTWFAGWKIDEGHDFMMSVAVAKWWASEAGNRVAHSALHLHGGLGNDVSYPLHRYYLWAKQIDATFGAPSQQLACIGAELASGYETP